MNASLQSAREVLRRKIHDGDPAADAVAEAIAGSAPGEPGATVLGAVGTLLRAPRFDARLLAGLGRNDPHIEAALERFMEATAAMPPAHSAAAIAAGNRLFEDNAVFGFVGLGCTSLLECYCWTVEARVLGLTHGLDRNIARRIPETAMFVLDVMGDVTLGADGDAAPRGLEAIRKVRLLHALIRWLVVSVPVDAGRVFDGPLKDSPFAQMIRAGWPEPEYGKPISQAFLAGTLLTFSLTVIDSMRRMWLPVSAADAADYLHRWKVIGYKLGVDGDLLAWFDGEDSARQLHAAMMAEFRGPTEPGALMAKALENYMIENIVDRVPFHRPLQLHRMPRVVMWHLAGKQTCRAVGLEPGLFGKTLGWFGWQGLRVIGFLKRVPLLKRISYGVFEWLGRAMWGWRHEDDPTLAARESQAGRPPARGVVFDRDLAEKWGVPRNS
jgi:hypothetical protein